MLSRCISVQGAIQYVCVAVAQSTRVDSSVCVCVCVAHVLKFSGGTSALLMERQT